MFNYATLIFIVIVVLPIFIAPIICISLFKRHKRGRRSPLTGNLLRGAGETLRAEIEKLSEKIDEYIYKLFTLFVPPLALLMVFYYLGDNKLQIWQILLAVAFYVLLTWWATRRLYLLLKQRSNLYLGLDAELAVGQELNHLMLQGCRVFHDFPAENFNIDHVVVGPGGVIAVETKGRAKPDKGRGSVDATVIYDGQILRFPDWHEKEPLEQAKRQADWLLKWLSSAVGEPVQVRPALALPGWFIERTKQGNVIVFNGKSPHFLAKLQNPTGTLAPQMIQRIAHQLEERCRDVEPVAYRKAK
jgi:hypothetical protein